MNKKKSEPVLLVILVFAVMCMVFIIAYSLQENPTAVISSAYLNETYITELSSVHTAESSTTESTTSTTSTTLKPTAADTTTGSENITESTTSTTVSPVTVTTTTFKTEEVMPEGKVAYLTFDDGPSKNTVQILDILDRYNVKATFFVISKKYMDEEYKMIVERGHCIALHAYSHTYSRIYKSEEAYFADLSKISDRVYNLTGVRSRIIRFPGGSSNTIHKKYCKGLMDKLKISVEQKGYIYHDWNVDSTDATANNVPVEKLLLNIIKYSKGKDVINILMHDTGESKQTTVDALPQIIEYLKAEGYNILPITESTPPIHHK